VFVHYQQADGIIGMDFLAERKVDLNLQISQLRLLTATKLKHGFESQGTRQARENATHVGLSLS